MQQRFLGIGWAGAQLGFLQVVLVALRQARPRRADGMDRPGRSWRRRSSQV